MNYYFSLNMNEINCYFARFLSLSLGKAPTIIVYSIYSAGTIIKTSMAVMLVFYYEVLPPDRRPAFRDAKCARQAVLCGGASADRAHGGSVAVFARRVALGDQIALVAAVARVLALHIFYGSTARHMVFFRVGVHDDRIAVIGGP